MKITAVMWNSYLPLFRKAAKSIGTDLCIHATRDLEDKPEKVRQVIRDCESADLILLYRTGSLFWTEIEDEIRRIGQTIPIVCVGYDPSYWLLSTVDPAIVATTYAYISYNGRSNIENLLKYLPTCLLGINRSPQPPIPVPWEGICHPDAARDALTMEEFMDWYPARNAPWIAVLLSRTAWVTGNLAMEHLVIRSLEEKGLNVIPVFTYAVRDDALGAAGMADVIERFLLSGKMPKISALVKLVSFFVGASKEDSSSSANPGRGVSVLSRLGVPVFQPIIAYYTSISRWEEENTLTGDIGWSVALPEFEGVIEPIIIGAQAEGGEPSGQRRPIPDRVEKLARRVARWVRLTATPRAERKVAFILHNAPCAGVEANIGSAAHLDSLESVARILATMKKEGYQVTHPASGEELARLFLDKKAISEFRWTTAGDIVAHGGCLARIPRDEYTAWFAFLPERTQAEMTDAWGEPPGKGMVFEDTILVTGLSFENAIVCVQPKRGCYGAKCDGEVCKILHDPHVPPTHQYLATYHWIDQVFGADLIIHVGTHGNLEFLPGKGVALSGTCYPDIAIGDMPHLYIYNADNPAEGAIAKRRSYACIIDHLMPVMEQAGLYDELEDLERILDEYESARYDPARAHALAHEIGEAIQKAHLEREFPVNHDTDIGDILPRLHEQLSRLRLTKIPVGMHIFGNIPDDGKEIALIRAVLEYETGPGSLQAAIAGEMGYSSPILVSEPKAGTSGDCDPDGRIREEISARAARIITAVLAGGKTGAAIGLPGSDPGTVDLLVSRILDIHERIQASDEMRALLSAMNGSYIPPGPSGLITRGRDDILPTGRNFYSLDPHRLPSRSAYTVGEQLAYALLKRYREEHGQLPESVGYYWMANDVMWTDGEGLAQLFALIGVRPVWQGNGRVKSFTIIPPDELGRPRIDILVRASGIIRDNFPHLIELLDDAVSAVAALDEPDGINYVRKHAREAVQEQDSSWREATLRIFAGMEGTYSSGVNLAVYAGAWKEEADLADIYLAYNGYAYGRGVSGTASHGQFAKALSTVGVTFNKMPTDEYDLLGCCCYFANQGGMTAAARQLSGKEIPAYFGDTREPGQARVNTLGDEIRRVVRSKILNPRWIEGMKEHGYRGAAEISKRVGRVYGWEAATQEVDDWIFDEVAETFVNDPQMRDFFAEKNPYALEEMARRLLEAEERGLWDADPEILEELKNSYLEIESWMEDEEHVGEFQGGSVDIITRADAPEWDASMLQVLGQVRGKMHKREQNG